MPQQVLTFGMAKKGMSYMVEAASMAYQNAGSRYVKRYAKAFASPLIYASTGQLT
jgi:hypothetical protein